MLAKFLQGASHHCKVVGCAVNAAEIRIILKKQKPQVAIISPNLEDGPLRGFDLVQEICDSSPATRSIVLLDSMEPQMVIWSFQVGAKGVFSREKSIEALSKCIDAVHGGQIWASANELQILVQAIAKRLRLDPLRLKGTKNLTSREAEVADLVAEGLRNHEIADRLSLSTHTVKNYLYRAYEKLGVSSRVELAALVLAPKLARDAM